MLLNNFELLKID